MSREPRNYLSQYLDIIEISTNEHLGYVADVSDGGLMFITGVSIAENVIKDVVIQNKIVSEDIPELSITAKIKTQWQKPSIDSKYLCIGCIILEIDADDQQRLNELVTELSYNDDIQIHRTSSH